MVSLLWKRKLIILIGLFLLLSGSQDIAQAAPPDQRPPDLYRQEAKPDLQVNSGGYRLGDLPSAPELYPPKLPPSSVSSQGLPALVDHTNLVPPVRSQGSQGSCVAWATGYYYKSFHEALQYGWTLSDVNHQFSPAFLYNQRLNDKCQMDDGWSLGSAMWMLQQKGDVSLVSFPYNENDTCSQPLSNQLQAAAEYRAADFGAFFINNRDNTGSYVNELAPLKQELASGNIIVFSIPTYDEFDYLNNITPPFSCVMDVPNPSSTKRGNHAVAIIEGWTRKSWLRVGYE